VIFSFGEQKNLTNLGNSDRSLDYRGVEKADEAQGDWDELLDPYPSWQKAKLIGTWVDRYRGDS
jgi:hypothetical protein